MHIGPSYTSQFTSSADVPTVNAGTSVHGALWGNHVKIGWPDVLFSPDMSSFWDLKNASGILLRRIFVFLRVFHKLVIAPYKFWKWYLPYGPPSCASSDCRENSHWSTDRSVARYTKIILLLGMYIIKQSLPETKCPLFHKLKSGRPNLANKAKANVVGFMLRLISLWVTCILDNRTPHNSHRVQMFQLSMQELVCTALSEETMLKQQHG